MNYLSPGSTFIETVLQVSREHCLALYGGVFGRILGPLKNQNGEFIFPDLGFVHLLSERSSTCLPPKSVRTPESRAIKYIYMYIGTNGLLIITRDSIIHATLLPVAFRWPR